MENASQIPKQNMLEVLQESMTVKLILIGMLVLALLIPAAWINFLIEERQDRAGEVVSEISAKWSGSQTLTGPILAIPYSYTETVRSSFGAETTEPKSGYAFFLPEKLEANGIVEPQVRRRGIFDAVVYTSNIKMKATFRNPDFASLNIPEEDVNWSKARLIFGISDLRGLGRTPDVRTGGQSLDTEPSADIYERPHVSSGSVSGVIARTGWSSASDFNGDVELDLKLKGSQALNFIPAAKQTSVALQGSWGSPSFDGAFLPEEHVVTEDDFSATWNILHYNRPFPQQWVGNDKVLSGSEFGVNLLVPVDQYQKSARTSKYAALIIVLTFVSLFLVEITLKIRVHPFQYTLIGAALIVYYTLLLSISEQIGFNGGYWIATLATVTLVSLYARTFLQRPQYVTFFALMLSVFYAFIFVIILQQDLSLLIGSIGLFIVVGLLMYFSRGVTWYKKEVIRP